MRRILISSGAVVVLVALLALAYRTELIQLWAVAHLFDEADIVENFQNMDQTFQTREVMAGGDVMRFERGSYSLPAEFEFGGRT